MEWVASTLTLPRNVVYLALLSLMRTPRLPAVDWTEAPADLNGFVRFGERRNLVSARVPSGFKRTLHTVTTWIWRTKISLHCYFLARGIVSYEVKCTVMMQVGLLTTEMYKSNAFVNPLAPEFPFKFLRTLYLKCE